MTLWITKTIRSILTVLFICLIMGTFPLKAVAEPVGGVSIEGDSKGLVVKLIEGDPYVDVRNLNPGDKKCSRLILENTGKKTLTVYMRTNIDSETTLNNGYLADVTELAIKDGDSVITDKLFRAAAADGNISIGKMSPGSEKTLDFCVNLPAEKTGNAYQGASMKVNWTFTTTSSHHDDDDDGDDDDDEDEDEDEDPSDSTDPIDDVPTPTEPNVVIEVNDEEVPVGPGMPYTGETSPLFFYGAGAIITVLGLTYRKK